MPHTFVRNIGSKLPEYAILLIGAAQSLVIRKVQALVQEIIDKLTPTCPPPKELERLTKSLDSLEKIMIGVEKTINKINKLPRILDGAIIALKIYLDIQYHFRPDFVAVPFFGPIGAPTFAARMTKINKIQRRIRKAEERLEDLQAAQDAIRAAVLGAKVIIAPILTAIELIRSLLNSCYLEQPLTDEERKELLKNLQEKTQDQYVLGIPYESESGYKYTIKVINDPSAPPVAPKRQAIVLDYRGITVLTGPSSFASSPEILVEEIKFRINNQLP